MMEIASPIKVLIVDDQREVRRMLKAALESEFSNAHVLDVPSAEEAIVLLSREAFHLLVVDVRLAGMSGLEMAEKALRRQPDLPIVAITGLDDPSIQQKLAQAPFRAWFRKPVPVEDFLTCVKGLVENIPSSATQEIPIPSGRQEEAPSEILGEIGLRLGLGGMWIEDSRGNLLAQSGSAPTPFQLGRAKEYFAQVERQIESLQAQYGSEKFPPLSFYLDPEYLVARLTSEPLRVTFWIARADLPTNAQEMQRLALQKAQEVYNSLNQMSLPSAEHLRPEETADPLFEQLFKNPSTIDPTQLKRAEEFWEQSVASGDWSAPGDSQTLPHDQARQLGFLSFGEDESAVER